MTPQEAIKHFGIIKVESKNAKGETIQTLIDFRFPNRCDKGHKTDSVAMRAFAKGVLLVLDGEKDLTKPLEKITANA